MHKYLYLYLLGPEKHSAIRTHSLTTTNDDDDGDQMRVGRLPRDASAAITHPARVGP